jgi:hypothetical protein
MGETLFGLMFSLNLVVISRWLIIVIYFGLIGVLIGTIRMGLSHNIIETKNRPNQGIWLSLRNAILIGLSFGLAIGLVAGLIEFSNNNPEGFKIISEIGLLFGVMAALWYGGLDVIQHAVLRLILYVKGNTPWNYAHFLDYAAEHILLRKVGGGYIFIHRLLLDYFAQLKI